MLSAGTLYAVKSVLVVVSLLFAATACRSGSIGAQAVDESPTAVRTSTVVPASVPEAASDENAPESTETSEAEVDETTIATVVPPGFIVEEVLPTPTPLPVLTATPVPTSTTVDLQQIFATDDWCSAGRKMETNFARLQAADLFDPLVAEPASAATIEMISQAIVVAPDELAGPLTDLRNVQIAIGAGLEAVDWYRIDLDPSVYESIADESVAAQFALDEYNFEVCGFDNGFDPASDPAVAIDDLPTVTRREQMVTSFTDQGFSQAEAECMAQNFDFANQEQYAGPEGINPLLQACEIGQDRVQEIFG